MLAQAFAPLARWWRGGGAPAPALLSELDARQQTPARPDTEKRAILGTKVSGGRFWDIEDNAELDGDLWPPIAEDMRRTDPVIMAAERALINTQQSATWSWKVPDDASPKARQANDWLNEAFGFTRGRGYIRGGFERVTGQALRFQGDGFRYMEEVYYVGPDRKVYVDFADCDPRAHDQWITDDFGALLEIVQKREYGPVGGPSREFRCPANKLVLFTHGLTGGNFAGTGLLRPCWFWRKLKQHTADMMAIGVERWAVPTPVVTVDYESLKAQGLSEDEQTAIVAKATTAAKNYTSHGESYLVCPDGITFGAFGAEVGDRLMPGEVLKLCDQQILMAWGLQFLLLGINDTGSRSVGETHASFFRQQCKQGNDQIAAVIGGEGGTLPRLMQWNFPSLDPAEWPRLCHEGLDPGPLLDLLPTLAGCVSAGLVTPTNALERMILSAFKAPDLTTDDERDYAARLATTNPTAAAGALFSDRNRRTL